MEKRVKWLAMFKIIIYLELQNVLNISTSTNFKLQTVVHDFFLQISDF